MPMHALTTRYGLGEPVIWTGEPGTRFVVITVVVELRPAVEVVVTYGLHDPAHPRPKVVWATEAELTAADAEKTPQTEG